MVISSNVSAGLLFAVAVFAMFLAEIIKVIATKRNKKIDKVLVSFFYECYI